MTVAELLVSTCITVLVAGAALSAVLPLQRGFAAQPESTGLIQRARVVSELLSGDLRHASLVLPFRVGALGDDISRGVFYRSDVITAVTDPADALASGLVTPASSRTYHLTQDRDGIWQLMQYDGQWADLPLADNISELTFEYYADAVTRLDAASLTDGPWLPDPTFAHRFDADLLRVRRVKATVRARANLAWLHAPIGDRRIAIEIAPRAEAALP